MNKLKKALNVLKGKTPEGLDKNFVHALGEYVRQHPEKCAEWKRQHPDRFLPLQIDPRTGKLVWADRKTRRKYSRK